MNIKGKNWAERNRTKIARQNDINRLTHENERLRSDNENLRRHNESLHRSNCSLEKERDDRVQRYKYEDVERRMKYFEKAYNDAKNEADSQKKISEQLRMSLNKSIREFSFLLLAFACIVIYLIFF